MQFPNFVGPSYESQSSIAAGEKLVNWYVEELPAGSKNQFALFPCPGIKAFATLTDSPGRGIFGENGRCFAVAGTTLFEIDSGGTPTSRGTVAQNDNPAQMVTNGDGGKELFISSGAQGYVLDLTTNILTNPVSAVDFAGQVDGFFVALDANSSTLKISESLDGSTWDATQIAQRTSASDNWEAMIVIRREILLMGSRSSEVWYNAGRSPFPFARRPDAYFEVGVMAPYSLARFGNTAAWLGQSVEGSGIVYWLNGYTPERISNHAVEWAIQQYKAAGGITDAVGWSYEQQGHGFYCIDFPSAEVTWCYDNVTRQWHERGKWNTTTGSYGKYRARFQVEMFEKNLVCDNSGTGVHSLDPTTYTDVDGSVLRRVRRAPHINQENQRLTFDRLELEADRGVGLTSGQGSDPQLMLRYSNDGGKTFGTQRNRTLGKIGEWDTRIRWNRCGSARDRVFEVAVSDPVPARLLNAYLTVRAGRA